MTVTCTNTSCPNTGITYTVPNDGYPVTCGGCDAILANAAH